jgi:hypothetical protein
MLAYIFWHRPSLQIEQSPRIEQKAYEDAVERFQSDLAGHPPPGLIGAWSHRIDPVPWLGGQPGYEDWCLLEGSWAIDPLNGFAITGPRQPSHDHVAALSGDGAGGLYAHAGGEILEAPQTTVYWLSRPRGIQWQAAIAPVRAKCREAVIWRRQMVLGPATEFAVEVPGDMAIEVPAGWQLICRVHRVRLPR